MAQFLSFAHANATEMQRRGRPGAGWAYITRGGHRLGREGERAQTLGNKVEGRWEDSSGFGRSEKQPSGGHSPLFPPIAQAQSGATSTAPTTLYDVIVPLPL